jgi:hypothetical protein
MVLKSKLKHVRREAHRRAAAGLCGRRTVRAGDKEDSENQYKSDDNRAADHEIALRRACGRRNFVRDGRFGNGGGGYRRRGIVGNGGCGRGVFVFFTHVISAPCDMIRLKIKEIES